ncbi:MULTISPECIES: RluA family pseudouridine synthase [unclassified Helicobacter]|uniref:RluA family pseudouridine synthase n=1 Tax=unclassified Helicobacter TaxID=2593540 RepID=UPI001F561418|nr:MULTISPECIES: RluA family pseudouridine synthase [unclassified Helicobacter]MCI2236078.1 RluA family pseudouridine synthase [Helicobacter sp. CaF467b]
MQINKQNKHDSLTFYVQQEESKMRLDKFLAQKLGLSRNQISKIIQEKQITLNGIFIQKNGTSLNYNDQITLTLTNKQAKIKPSNLNIPILYEDEDLLILNKPINLIVHQTHQEDSQYTLQDWLQENNFPLSNLGDSCRQGIIHRLDKTTSGAIVIAKNNHAHEILSQQLKSREMGRYYLCVIDSPLKQNILIDTPLIRHPRNRLKYIPTTKNTPLSKEAKTAFYKIINNNKIELIGAKLFSGRTHQIRAHLSKIQRHILGDAFYGYKGNYTTRILLHSHLLYLTHPTTKQRLEIYAPFWEDMLLFLHQEFYPTQNLEYFKKNFKIPLDQLYHSSFSNS